MSQAVAAMEELGIEFETNNWFDSESNTVEAFTLKSTFVVPNQIITMIKNAPALDLLDVAGDKRVDAQILKYKKIVFHPEGILQWTLPDVTDAGDFVAICARELVLNSPNAIAQMPLLNVLTPYTLPPQDGTSYTGGQGNPGSTGTESGDNNGWHGGVGGDGGVGVTGGSYTYPIVYIFFNKITINIANPNITSALKINANGINGGTGGKGGTGGRGGNGSTGSSGSSNMWGCTGGNGAGGNGGVSGKGGKGGRAGRGGNGATLSFIGPDSFQDKLNHVEMFNVGGRAGNPGQHGDPGSPGNAGGAGSQPSVCGQSRGNGSPGSMPNPTNLGIGDTNMDGFDGAVYVADRDNSDLF